MVTTNDLKIDIINLITKINDLEKLKLIYQEIEAVDSHIVKTKGVEQSTDFKDAIVEIREGITFNEILMEQNYQPTTYKDFRDIADQIEWEHSLDELLVNLQK